MTDLPPYDPATSPKPAGSTRPAELLDRFLARLIDGVIVGVVYAVVGLVLIAGLLLGPVDSAYVAGAVTAIVLVALQLGYFVYLDTTRGQTVGKMLLKLRVLGPQGGLPTVEQSLRRNIWLAAGLAGVVPIVGGLLGGAAQLVAVVMIAVGINGDPVNRQAWHDHFAGGTRVVKES
jgi:uncharacterized RDD family membrane protein YckC